MNWGYSELAVDVLMVKELLMNCKPSLKSLLACVACCVRFK